VKRENGEKEREGDAKKEGREKWSSRVRLSPESLPCETKGGGREMSTLP